MKQSSKTLRKMLAVALAVATIGSAGIMTEVGSFVGTNLTAEAASYEIYTYNDITYALYSDGTATAMSYSGTNKDFSASSFSVPSVIYASNLGKDYILNYSQFTVTKLQADGFSGIKARIFGLPNSLQTLFGGFKNTEIGVFSISTNNSYFSTSNGFLSNKSGATIMAYPTKPSLYYTSDFIYIPSTVTSVDMYAFTGYKATSLTLPSSVTYVGRSAFQYSSLYSVTFEGSPDFWCANDDQIGTFDDAANLDAITIKGTSGKYSTYNGAVYNKDQTVLMCCPKGRTTSTAFAISSKATQIGNYAFENCKKLTAIEIPETITSIGSYGVFSNTNSNLVLYVIQDSCGHTYAKNNNMTYKVIYPYTKKSDNTLTITGYDGPWNSFSIPSKINGYTVSEIGANAFKSKTAITSVTVPSGVTSIGENAFYGCSKLSSISLPSTVTSIGKKAFYNTIATSITIPSSMTEIGEEAFYGMSKIEKISIPSKITKIGTYAFGFDSSLTSVAIPNAVTQINFAAFYGCSNLINLNIGSGVKTIGGSAFCNTGLTSQYIPKNVTSIGSYAFGYTYSDSQYSRNSSFTEISGYPNTAAQTYCTNYDVPFNSILKYSTSSDGKSIKIEKYTGTDTVVVIPDKIDGLPVTSIAGYAFNGTNVTNITLPRSMTSLDGYALYGARKLTTVKFPSGITSIGSYAFEFCTSLKSINIPSTVTSIGTGAFYGCTSLSYVNLGQSMKTIGKYVFTNTALTSVTVPKTVTSIGDHAFGYTYSNSVYTPVDSFTMTGYAYTAADTYAANNSHITFNPQYESVANTTTISATEIKLGQSITINFSYTGGKKPYTYAAMYSRNGNSSFTSIQSYTSNSSVAFKPTQTGVYTINTYVKDNRGTYVLKAFTLTVTTDPVENTSTISAETATAGDTITVNASAVGGNGSYQYSLAYRNTDSVVWTTVQTLGTNTDISFALPTGGEYEISVQAADSDGKKEYKYFTVTVYDKLVNTSEISAETVTLGEKVVITGSADGGRGDYTYKFSYTRDGINYWADAASSGSTCTFVPNYADTYHYKVTVTDSNGNTDEKVFDVTAFEQLDGTISTDKVSMKLGDTVTAIVQPTGGDGEYYCRIYYTDKSSGISKIVQDYDLNNLVTMVLPSAGEYTIGAIIMDGSGSSKNVSCDVTVEQNELVNTSTIANDEITLGDRVYVTPSAEGGAGEYTYAVLYKKKTDTSWVTKQNFSANTENISILPSKAADYEVCVKVKDADGTIVKKFFDVKVKEPQAELVNNSTMSAASISKGDTVTLTGKAAGGSGDYTYAFLYKKKTDTKWTTKQGFAANSTVEIKPAQAVLYDVCVKVKDSDGTIVKKFFDLTVTEPQAELVNNSSMSADSIVKGGTVTLTGTAVGGTGSYQYQFVYKKKTDTKWTTAQNFAENNTVTIKPAQAVAYDVCIKVKDSEGTIVKKFFDLTVTQALTSNSTISATTITKGQTVTVNGVAVGGKSPYTYAVYYKQNAQTNWTTKQNFNENATVAIKPAQATMYDVCIKIKDADGTVAKQYFTVEVQ